MQVLENLLLASYIIWPAVAIVNATSKRNAANKEKLQDQFSGTSLNFKSSLVATFLVTWVIAPVSVVCATFAMIARLVKSK